MKKIGSYIFLIGLSIISFYITQLTSIYLRKKDHVMISLLSIKDKYTIYSKEAKIKNNTIIPGINGRRININKSYSKIKRVGFFNEQVYDEIEIKNKLINNKDKYIIEGNNNKKMVSIILYLDSINNYQKNDSPLNYIINFNEINTNYEDYKKIIQDGNNVLIDRVSMNNINYLSTLLNKTDQKNKYCFNENRSNEYRYLCSKNNYYSINTTVITNNYLVNIKKELKSGLLIVLKGKYDSELVNIINYIKSKGYTIANLDNHLNESI